MKNKHKLVLLVPFILGLYSCNIRDNTSSLINSSSDASEFSSTSGDSSFSSFSSTESSTNSSTSSSESSSSEQTSSSVDGKLNSYLISIGNNPISGSGISNPNNLVLNSISSSVSISSLSKVFGAGDGVRVGTGSSIGEMSFSCDPRWRIKSIVVDGESFSKDTNVEINIKLSNGENCKNVFNGKKELSFDFNGTATSNKFTISTTKVNKRIVIHNITIYALGGEESNEGGNGGNTDVPVVGGNTLKYESNFNLTNGNVPSSKEIGEGYYRPTINPSLNFVDYCYWNYEAYLPSTGKSKLLVVPVDFSDYRAKDKLGS